MDHHQPLGLYTTAVISAAGWRYAGLDRLDTWVRGANRHVVREKHAGPNNAGPDNDITAQASAVLPGSWIICGFPAMVRRQNGVYESVLTGVSVKGRKLLNIHKSIT